MIKKKNSLKNSLKNRSLAKRLPAPQRPSQSHPESHKPLRTALNKKKTAASVNRSPVESIDNHPLPAAYHTTGVTLMSIDPHWLHAYWEIAASSLESIRKKIGRAFDSVAYVLRVYDITFKDFDGANANHWFDIDVGPSADNWYINIWSDNTSYCCDIGLRTIDGQFLTLARSNSVMTPRRGMSGRRDVIWMDVKDTPAQRSDPFVLVGAGKSATMPQRLKDRRSLETATPRKGSSVTSAYRRMPLSAREIKIYYERFLPLFKQVAWKGHEKKNGKAFLELRVAGAQRKDFEEGVWLEEEGLSDLMQEEFFKRFRAGASEEAALKKGASRPRSESRSEDLSSSREERKRSFFFEIWTELLVYGRTEPDATVLLGDQKIALRPDGTFSLRYALPDVKIPFPFIAKSADLAESRKITTAVERLNTVYEP